MSIVPELKTTPSIANTFLQFFWTSPAIPSPRATISRKRKNIARRPTRKAVEVSSSRAPGDKFSITPAMTMRPNISMPVIKLMKKEVIPSAEFFCSKRAYSYLMFCFTLGGPSL